MHEIKNQTKKIVNIMSNRIKTAVEYFDPKTIIYVTDNEFNHIATNCNMITEEDKRLARKLWDYHQVNHQLEKTDCILVLGSHKYNSPH